MITIIHGDDIVTSRRYFLEEKEKVQNPTTFSGGDISLTSLVQIFEGNALFEKEETVFIEDFLHIKKDILSYLQKTPKLVNVFLWEGKVLVKKQTDIFPNAVIKTFTLPKLLFTFLDSIRPGSGRKLIALANDVLKTTEADLLFFMLVRQFRLLLALSENASHETIDEVNRLAPWQKSKLQKQVGLFTKDVLKSLYKRLFYIDLEVKTGKSSLPLRTTVDFFLLEI